MCKIESLSKKSVSLKPFKRTTAPCLKCIFYFMLTFCKMTMDHNVIFFCKIYNSLYDIFCLILCDTWRNSHLTHRKAGTVMILFHQPDGIFCDTFLGIYHFRRYNIAWYRVESSGRMETDADLCSCLDLCINQILYSHRMWIPQVIGGGTACFQHIAQSGINTCTGYICIQIFVDLIHNSKPWFQFQTSCCLYIADQ